MLPALLGPLCLLGLTERDAGVMSERRKECAKDGRKGDSLSTRPWSFITESATWVSLVFASPFGLIEGADATSPQKKQTKKWRLGYIKISVLFAPQWGRLLASLEKLEERFL